MRLRKKSQWDGIMRHADCLQSFCRGQKTTQLGRLHRVNNRLLIAL